MSKLFDLIDEVEDLHGKDGDPLLQTKIEQIQKGLELLQWFDDMVIFDDTYPLLEKASKKFGIPKWDTSADHMHIVREELREILS